MLIVYGDADCKGNAVRWLYQERYPSKRVKSEHKVTGDWFLNKSKGCFVVKWTPYLSLEDFIARISVAARKMRDMKEIFQNARNSMKRHYQTCHMTSGRNFQHVLQ
ncbi:hypothetical protein TNCV_1542861 [Trichonephila clavipes]|nr:hypothetical protein TNCV_1542861 [Trichonephila clavipes]